MYNQRLFLCLTLAILCIIFNPAFAVSHTNDPVIVKFGKPGQEQMPVIYVHGWADDGAGWGRGTQQGAACYGPGDNDPPSPSSFLQQAGIESWAVQWWSNNNGAPGSTSDEGYAFLVTGQELIDQSNWQDPDESYSAQNRPCPSALEQLTKNRFADVMPLFIKNTYNDSGRVLDHARDLRDLLIVERGGSGKFAPYSQVNIVTHSKGSLVTRSLLSMLAQASRGEYEFVSNVIYNAPPFAGSSVAELAARVFSLPEATLADVINDPLFIALLGVDPDRSVKDALTDILNITFVLMGYVNGLDDVRELFPPGTFLALELLEPFSLSNLPAIPFYDPATRLMLSAVRHFATNFTGFPAEPALSDLSMSSAAARLVAYPTSAFSKQFVTGGDWSIAYTTLFPCAMGVTLPCADDIADDPSLLYDLPSLILTGSDGVVAVGSSQLLTETAEFGEQMQRLDIIDAWHGDFTDPQKVGSAWLRALLAAPTDMILQGSVLANEDARSYLVSPATTFGFLSASVTRPSQPAGEEVTVAAARHEYRVVIVEPGDNPENNNTIVADWVTLDLGGSISFSDLESTYNLSNKIFYVQWRSINTTGGREMIRSAYFGIDQGAPTVVEENVLAINAAEVYQRNPANRFLDVALRADYFSQSSHPRLTAITQNKDAEWVVRNPGNKALTFALNDRGSFLYRWNNENLDSAQATRIDNTLGALVTLQELGDGLHTLYYQLSSLTDTGPLQSSSVFVDNTPPEVEIICEGFASFLCLVGPATPLQFSVHDLESNGGTGTLAIEGYPGGVVSPGRPFTLGETNLKALGQAAGAVGVVVPLTVNATDLVSNVLAETLEVYYDWTPPEVIIENVNGLPIDDGYRVFTRQVLIEVSLESSNGGAEAPIAQIIPMTGGAMSSATFQLNGNGRYEASIPLQPGQNRIIIASRDIVGNIGSRELMIDYSQAQFDQAPLTLLSHRIQDTCYNTAGDEVNCTFGNIENVLSSYYGTVAAFRSRSNRLVPNDTNGEIDVFVWRDGVLTRANTTFEGEQAIGGDSWARALSGNGRYLYFSSVADNLIEGTDNGNLYVKDLVNGELAVISRDFSGSPINRFAEQFEATATFNGRYVFFSSRKADYIEIENFDNPNNVKGIYMVDLDPDGNGYFFDNNYVTYPISNVNDISNVNATTMANGESQLPSVSSDGRYLVFRTAATDLHASLADNGAVRDILLLKFSGNADDGTLDTSIANRVIVPIAFDAHYPKVGPDDDTVVFSTRLNLLAADNNNPALDNDIYMSLGEGSGSGDVSIRSLELASLGFDGSASSSFNNGLPLQDVFIANEPGITGFAKKVGWVAAHDNIVLDDTNDVEDLFIRRDSAVFPDFPDNLAVPNWITADLPSKATVQTGAMSADGRYAFWVNQQQYISPYAGDAEMHLFRRRIEPLRDTVLSISINGNGVVQRVASGEVGAQPNQFVYQDDDRVNLIALPDSGWRFEGWQQVDGKSKNSAIVDMHHNREVIANFVAASPPYSASASLLADEDQPSAAITPDFSDDDIGDTHVFSIVQQATNGLATIQNNRLRYTPNLNFNGSDSFAFQITDSFGLSLAEAAVAEVTINPVNDAPLTTSLNMATQKDNASALVVPEVNDVDVGDSFSIELLAPALNGSAEVMANAIRYTPAANFIGNDSFSYSVIDSGGLSVIGIASVQVNDSIVNDPIPEPDENDPTPEPDEKADEDPSGKNEHDTEQVQDEALAAENNGKKKKGFFGAIGFELIFFIFSVMLLLRLRRLLFHKYKTAEL